MGGCGEGDYLVMCQSSTADAHVGIRPTAADTAPHLHVACVFAHVAFTPPTTSLPRLFSFCVLLASVCVVVWQDHNLTAAETKDMIVCDPEVLTSAGDNLINLNEIGRAHG